MSQFKHTGFAIAIAWPQTYCKQPGAWYDPITFKLGINKNHYYKVGHAALLLIEQESGNCYYYDFGRYHSPFQHGRVRGSITDHELVVHTKAKIDLSTGTINNFKDILTELQLNEACHGEGEIHASYTHINFEKANAKALQMQKESPIAYGPFVHKGSNCSRFVQTVILAGKPKISQGLKLKYNIPISPTPLSNVKALRNKLIVPKLLSNNAFEPVNPLDRTKIKTTLEIPEKHPAIPESAQWLSGEGAGSWYDIVKNGKYYQVYRYSPKAETECLGEFQCNSDSGLPSLSSLQFTYPSNCAEITLKDSTKTYRLDRL